MRDHPEENPEAMSIGVDYLVTFDVKLLDNGEQSLSGNQSATTTLGLAQRANVYAGGEAFHCTCD